MTKQKILYLGIIHSIVMEKPTMVEIINNPAYEQELKDMIAKLKKKANLAKAINKVAGKHIKKIKGISCTTSKASEYFTIVERSYLGCITF